MRTRIGIGATFGSAFLAAVMAHAAVQTPAVRAIDETVLREYAGVYQWGPNAFVYLQMWDEFSGSQPSQLVAFDDPATFGRSIRRIATASSPVPAPRFRRR